MKTRKGSHWFLNALIIAIIGVCVYAFVGKKYLAPLISQLIQGNMTAVEKKSPFGGIRATADKYNAKVSEEEKIRNQAIDALSNR